LAIVARTLASMPAAGLTWPSGGAGVLLLGGCAVTAWVGWRVVTRGRRRTERDNALMRC
jgi:hypothetical protein